MPGRKIVASNRKAYHDYFVDEKTEAGIELAGTEVKSVRQGSVNMNDCFCRIIDGEVYILGMHISPYEKGNIFNRDPYRDKKLLLHSKEILKLSQAVERKGVALIPLCLYLSGKWVKVELGICRGKKLYDKRETEAKRDAQREMQRDFKGKY